MIHSDLGSILLPVTADVGSVAGLSISRASSDETFYRATVTAGTNPSYTQVVSLSGTGRYAAPERPLSFRSKHLNASRMDCLCTGPRHSMGLPYMPTLTPLAPPQLIGIYASPISRAWGSWIVQCFTTTIPRRAERFGHVQGCPRWHLPQGIQLSTGSCMA